MSHRSLLSVALATVWRLLLLVSLLPTTAAEMNRTKFAFVLSQAGFNQLGNFTLTEGMRILSESPSAVVQLQSTAGRPLLSPLATVAVRNVIAYNSTRLVLAARSIGVVVRRPSLRTRADVSADLWPVFGGDERFDVTVRLETLNVSVEPMSTTGEGAGVVGFAIRDCRMDEVQVSAGAKRHWLLDAGASLGARLAQANFERLACAQIQGALDAMTVLVKSSVRLGAILDLPESLQDVTLDYKLTEFKVRDKHLSVGLAIMWSELEQANKTNGSAGDSANATVPSRQDGVAVEFGGENGYHLTVWLRDTVVNELLGRLDVWRFHWMTRDVPVSDKLIPDDSRAFLTTLCPTCFFKLNVWNERAPGVSAENDSLILSMCQRVNLYIVNPNSNRTAVFVNFLLYLDGEIVPYLDNGTLKADIRLHSTKVSMEKGAFPPQWKEFIQVLIKGMITDVMWPTISSFLESVSREQGIVLPSTCAINSKSAVIHVEDGRFGVGVHLSLADFALANCINDLRGALPKLPTINL